MELTNEAKNAILNIFANAAWTVGNGQQYYDALADAFFGVASISAVYTPSGTVTVNTALDDLKADLVVTATLKDSTTQTVPSTDYTLSGTLAVGTNTITVSYAGKTATFNVTVSAVYRYSVQDGNLFFRQGTGGYNETYGLYTSVSSTSLANRRIIYINDGELPFYSTTNDSTFTVTDPPIYPLPIPADATSVTYSITPSTQYMGISLWTYDGTKYTRIADPGWRQGGSTETFAAGSNLYFTSTMKYNNAGSAYVTDPTEITVEFS